jgi:hypothetical protein
MTIAGQTLPVFAVPLIFHRLSSCILIVFVHVPYQYARMSLYHYAPETLVEARVGIVWAVSASRQTATVLLLGDCLVRSTVVSYHDRVALF